MVGYISTKSNSAQQEIAGARSPLNSFFLRFPQARSIKANVSTNQMGRVNRDHVVNYWLNSTYTLGRFPIYCGYGFLHS